MTTPEGSQEEAVGYVSVAASAAGMAAEFEKIGRQCSERFASAVKQRTDRLGPEMLAGLDSGSASMAGAAFGEAIGRGLGAPIRLAREAFEGLTRSGVESADSLRTRYNTLDEQIRKTTASIKAMQAEARDSAATSGGSMFDANKIREATNELERYRRQQSEVADQLRATDEAAKGSGGSMEHAGFAAGIMGGAVVAGAQIATEGLEDIMEGARRAAEALIEVGEQGEQMSRALQLSTSATGEELEGLKSTIDQVATQTSASFEVITGAAGVLHQRLGLSGGALGLITQDFADFQKMTGQALDPGKFSAAMTALNVPAAQADQFLTQLFTLSRQTSVPLGELVTTISRNAAALHEFGLNALPVSSLLAQMSANGIDAQGAMRGLQTLSKSAAKDHETVAQKLREIVAGMEAAKAAGDRVAENEWASKLGKGALQFEAAVDQGILSTQTLNATLGDLDGEPIRSVFDDTATLSDKIAELGHTLDADLRPVGEAITESIGGGFTSISDWIKSNGPTVIQWVENLGDGAILVGGQIAQMFGNIMSGVGALEEAYGVLNDDDGAKKAGQSLEDLGEKLAEAGTNTDGLTKSWDTLMDKAKQNVTIGDDLKDALKLGPNGQGLELTDSKQLQADLDALRQAGVNISQTPHGLTVTADTPENEQRVKSFLDGIGAKNIPITIVPQIAPPAPAPAPGAPALPAPPPAPNSSSGGGDYPTPPNPNDQFNWLDPFGVTDHGGLEWLDPFGIFTDDQGGGNDDFRNRVKSLPPGTGGRPAPGAHPSGYQQIPGQVTVQPAAAKLGIGEVLDSAGIPDRLQNPDQGVVFPTGFTVGTNDAMQPDDLLSKAGIPDRFTGTVPGGGDGVTMPTAFDVKDGDRKSVGDLMQDIGIPSEQQGPDGVVLSVSYTPGSSSAGTPGGVVPAGLPGGPAGQPAGPIGPGQDGMAHAIFAAVTQAGYTPDVGQAAVAASLYESSLNPDITNASGHHGLFQESADKPSAGALQQIQWFLAELGRQGGPAAIASYPGGAPAFIADKIERGGYSGSNYNLSAAQNLLAQAPPAPDAAPGVQPAGYSSGSPAGGLPGASVTYTPDWMLQHGYQPILEKTGPDASGDQIPAAVRALAASFNLTATDHPDTSLHGGIPGNGNTIDPHASWAFDFSGAVANEQAFADAMKQYSSQIVQEIWQNPQTGQQDGIAGGQILNQGQYYTTPGGSYADHQDHVHVGFTSVPGAGGPMVQNAGYSVGGQPGIVNVDRVTPDPNTPVPNTGQDPLPGGPPTTPPPVPNAAALQAAPGAPNTTQTPFGTFAHTGDMSAEQQALLSPEQRYKFDKWLDEYSTALETATNTQDEINRAQQRVDKAKTKKDEADSGVLPGDADSTNAAAQADEEYANAVSDLAKAKRHQTDETNRQATEAEKPATGTGKTDKGDKNAEDLGKGFIGGIAQELGFGDVFGKDPTKWGLTKLLTGAAGFGLGLLGGGDKDSSSGASSPAGTGSVAEGGLLGVAESVFPGLKKILAPANTGTPAAPTTGPGAPTAPADVPGTVNAVPAGRTGDDNGNNWPGSTTNNTLAVTNHYAGFNPNPQVKDQIRTVANYTSAPAMSGGGGIPV